MLKGYFTIPQYTILGKVFGDCSSPQAKMKWSVIARILGTYERRKF